MSKSTFTRASGCCTDLLRLTACLYCTSQVRASRVCCERCLLCVRWNGNSASVATLAVEQHEVAHHLSSTKSRVDTACLRRKRFG